MGDHNLENYRSKFEKLHSVFLKSQESEKHLTQKCQELNAKIDANSADLSNALTLSQEYKATFRNLKMVECLDPCIHCIQWDLSEQLDSLIFSIRVVRILRLMFN